MLVCYDANTGKILWKKAGAIAPQAIAEGYLIGTSQYDGQQYCFGKGKTTATVTASPNTAVNGSGVLIEGTVMDLSPAQPNTPAVSEEDMSEWMDYLHGQNATLINSPPVPTGVSVQLTAVGSDGTVVDLGTVTTDSAGHFSKAWSPTAQGLYAVYAAFVGSSSYWSSSAETALSVGPAPETSQTPEIPTPVDPP